MEVTEGGFLLPAFNPQRKQLWQDQLHCPAHPRREQQAASKPRASTLLIYETSACLTSS